MVSQIRGTFLGAPILLGVIWGYMGDNGKEHGNCHVGFGVSGVSKLEYFLGPHNKDYRFLGVCNGVSLSLGSGQRPPSIHRPESLAPH